MSSSKHGNLSQKTEQVCNGLQSVTAAIDDLKRPSKCEVTKSKKPRMLMFWKAVLDSCLLRCLPRKLLLWKAFPQSCPFGEPVLNCAMLQGVPVCRSFLKIDLPFLEASLLVIFYSCFHLHRLLHNSPYSCELQNLLIPNTVGAGSPKTFVYAQINYTIWYVYSRWSQSSVTLVLM